jgi:hypothetical protein
VHVTHCRDRDAVRVYTMGGKEKGDVGGNKGYIYSSCCDFLVQGSTCEICWLSNIKWRSLQHAAPPGISGTMSLETRLGNRGEDSL